MRIINTLAGVLVLYSLVFAADCLPAKTPTHPHVVFGDAGTPLCASGAAPSMLCDRVTKTAPPRECAICPDPARHCLTATGIYCSTSCDEPLCDKR